MIKCRMSETPPGWQINAPSGSPKWVFDPNFLPIILNNKNVTGQPEFVVNEIIADYDRCVSRIGAGNPSLPKFTDDLAVGLFNFGGQGAFNGSGVPINNPTSFIVDDPASNLQNVSWHPDGLPVHQHPEHHIWFEKGINDAKDWTVGAATEPGFLTRLEAAVAANLLDELPTRLIVDTELPMHPIMSDPNPNNGDKANQTRRLQAMLADSRATTNLIPYQHPNGRTLAQWFDLADQSFTTPGSPYNQGDPWILNGGRNFDEDMGLGAAENRQFDTFMLRLWYMQVDRGVDVALRQPLRARAAWNNTLISNYSFAQTDDASALNTNPTFGTRPIKSNEIRANAPTFQFGWHFQRTANPYLPQHQSATRVGLIGFPDARAGGSANLSTFVSSGQRTVHTTNSCTLDLQAPHLYSVEPVFRPGGTSGEADLPGHRQPNLYRPPTAWPFEPYGTSYCVNIAPCHAPEETDEEMLARLWRYRLESVMYSAKRVANEESVTPWFLMPYLDTDPVGGTSCTPPTGSGPMPSVSLDGLLRSFMLARAFGLREINLFGDKVGCTTCSGQTICFSGSMQTWTDTQDTYYRAMNPYLYDFTPIRGQFDDPLMEGDLTALRLALQENGGPREIGLVAAHVPSVGRQTSLRVSFAGLPIFSMPTYGGLRVVLEGRINGLVTVTGRLFAETRAGGLAPLTISDYDWTQANDPLRGSYGYWSQDRSARRVFDFDSVNLHDIIDQHGVLRLHIVETNAAGTASSGHFTSFHDLVQVAVIPVELVGEAGFAGEPGDGTVADQDYNGEINAEDGLLFLEDYAAAAPGADFTGDGDITGDDLIEYMSAWATQTP